MNAIFNKLPRSILVFLVISVGVLAIFIIQKPHSVCDSQLESFIGSQRGLLFPAQIKGQKKAPVYGQYLESCRLGNSPGACYELFSLMRKALRDFEAAPQKCYPEMQENGAFGKALRDVIELMALISWGAKPPEPGAQRFAWLETSDLALFCQMRKIFISIYGFDEFESFRLKIQKKLPGEELIFRDQVCLNCQNRKSAEQTLSIEEIWVRSIFSMRCDQF